MPMILDVSGSMYAALHVDLKAGGGKPQLAYIRHLVLNSILFANKSFRDEYGEMIIAFDNSSWRKRFFPLYKWVRYNALTEDDHDWEHIHQCMETITKEIMEHLPYPCVRVKYAEGDDVIGVLADKFTKEGEKVLIISGDKDMVERTKHPLCQQYRPVLRSMYDVDDPRRHEFNLFVRGDKDDGVPNILTQDDFYKMQYLVKQSGAKTPRASSIASKMVDEFWETYKTGNEVEIKAYLDNLTKTHNEKMLATAEKKTKKENIDLVAPVKIDAYANFIRNRKLISLNQIPDLLKDAIITAYDGATRNGIMKMLTYMQQNNMVILAQELKGFEPKRKRPNQIF